MVTFAESSTPFDLIAPRALGQSRRLIKSGNNQTAYRDSCESGNDSHATCIRLVSCSRDPMEMASDCADEEGIDGVEVTRVLGYTITNTTFTVCSWGGETFGIPSLTGANPECFCDPVGPGGKYTEMSIKTVSAIERPKLDESPIYGVVIKESSSLMMVHREVDFAFDGIVVVKKADISRVTTDDIRQRRYRMIMRTEGLWKSPGRSINLLPLTDWKVLLEALIGKPMLIEDEKKHTTWFGVVDGCDDKQVSLRCFDCLGVYDEAPVSIAFKVITSIQFGDRYTQLQYKYSVRR